MIYEIIDYEKLHEISKPICYAMIYGQKRLFQKRIDEEGCGAVFCAACLEV